MHRLILAALAAASLAGAAGAAAAQPLPAERWGHWDPAWGARPGPPPRAIAHHWRARENMWYGHVHTCMARPHYDPRRDMYRVGRRWVVCAD
jgi:hypothetical protein